MKKRFVVYTCLTGGYDVLKNLSVVDDEFDYICFTDNAASVSDDSLWQARAIERDSLSSHMLSRFPKICAHEVLSDYECSLYIDANIDITSKVIYDKTREAYAQKKLWAGVRHPSNKCIYKEGELILQYGRMWYHELLPVVRFLKKEQFPANQGLFENSVIFRFHNDESVIAVSQLWWHMLEKYCKRDQMSLFYVFWKLGFTPDLLIEDTLHGNPAIKIVTHSKATSKSVTRWRIRINTRLLRLSPFAR